MVWAWLRHDLLAIGESEPLALFGARTPADLPMPLLDGWRVRVEELPVEFDSSVLATMEKGLATLGLDEILRSHKGAAVALCGPDPMMKAAARIAVKEEAEVWVCLEEQMACGAGVCRSCAIPVAGGASMKTVCRDGPVFRLDEIDYV